jgi:hypothetical protein
MTDKNCPSELFHAEGQHVPDTIFTLIPALLREEGMAVKPNYVLRD